MSRTRLIAVAIATVAASAPAAEALGAQPKRPSGQYSGEGGRFMLIVSGRTIDVAAFDFPCGATRGRTTVNDVRIRKRRGRWRFSIRTFGSATFDDERPDANVRIAFSGRFSPTARVATGKLTVSASTCGSKKTQDWTTNRLQRRT